jgi:hypothetical protein
MPLQEFAAVLRCVGSSGVRRIGYIQPMTTEPSKEEPTGQHEGGGDPLEPDLPDPAPEFEPDDDPDDDPRPPGLPGQEPA